MKNEAVSFGGFFDRNAIQTVLVSNSFMELLSDMNNLEYTQ